MTRVGRVAVIGSQSSARQFLPAQWAAQLPSPTGSQILKSGTSMSSNLDGGEASICEAS